MSGYGAITVGHAIGEALFHTGNLPVNRPVVKFISFLGGSGKSKRFPPCNRSGTVTVPPPAGSDNTVGV